MVLLESGVIKGLLGTLVRKWNTNRSMMTLGMLNQHEAIKVDAEDLELFAA